MVCTRFFSRQTQLLVELKTGLAEDGDDPSARSDIGQLLRPLRLRHDVTYRIRNEIDQVLASIESAETTDAQARPHEPKTAEAEPTPATQSSPSPQRVSGPAPSAPDVPAAGDGGGASTKRLVGVGGAVLAASTAIALTVVLLTQSGPKKASAGQDSAPAPPAAPERLESILLPPRDVAASMGTPSMEIANQSQQLRAPTGNLSNPDCLGAFEPIGESTYAGSGTKAVRGQQLHTPDNNLRVDEAVVGFPNAQRATAFVAAQAEQWKACAGQAVTLTTEHGREFHWTFGELTGTSPAITQVRMPRDPRRASCQRVLSAVSDVVFDVEACAANVADQGSQIADQMAAKVTPLARPG